MPPKLPPSKPPTKAPVKAPGKTKPKVTLPKSPARQGAKQHQKKTFQINSVSSEGAGQKIVIYGKSGIGKSTLASMADNPVFLDIDGGCRNLVHPETGEPVMHIGGIETFQDLRDVLQQPGLFPEGCTIVLDTITKVESLAIQHILDTVTIDGRLVQSFRKFGWDGERHLLDQYRLLLTDLDAHVEAGRNVILLGQLAQITVANAEGADYLEDGPKLQHRKDCSVRTEVIEWADQVLRIGYLDFEVQKDSAKAKAGKVTSNDATRAVFAGGAQHFIAKSRPVNGVRLEPVIRFAAENDNALWSYIFGQDPFIEGDPE